MLRRSAILLVTWTQKRLVVDGKYVRPQPTSDFLLQDLSFGDIAQYFPKPLLHAPCDSSAKPEAMFALSNSDRALTLMPVTTKVGKDVVATSWAPFLIDCGSPQTFFCELTRDALKLDTADHTKILGKGVNWSKSSRYFDDINLLGTDFLKRGNLSIRYSAREVDFKLVAYPDEFWVTDGKSTFPVVPKDPQVMYLKAAIKEYMLYQIPPPHIIVKDPTSGTVLGDKDTLQDGVEYTYELPK